MHRTALAAPEIQHWQIMQKKLPDGSVTIRLVKIGNIEKQRRSPYKQIFRAGQAKSRIIYFAGTGTAQKCIFF
jgi:hypothetical protein